MATLKGELTAKVIDDEHWAKRRRFGRFGRFGPIDRRLWVLACMVERLPINGALGINVDSPVAHRDAHCFRNAGGVVTEDAIRSAMLSTVGGGSGGSAAWFGMTTIDRAIAGFPP